MKSVRISLIAAVLVAPMAALAQPQPTKPGGATPAAQPGVTSPATTPPGATPQAGPTLPPPTQAPTGPNGAPTTPGTPDVPTAGAPPPVDWLGGVTDLTGPTAAGVVTLSLDHAVELALKTQPTLREAKATAEANFGRVDQARVARHPVVTLAGGVTVGSSNPSCGFNIVNGMQVAASSAPCGGYFHPTIAANLGASASWRLYDFGLTDANVAVAELNAESSVASIDSSGLDVRLNVASAYLLSVADNRLVKVAAATVKSTADHLDQAKRFVAAQAHDPIEVAQAQAAYANAKAALAQSQGNEATALANLRAAIGYVELQGAIVVDPNWPVPPAEDPPDLKALVDNARAHRPEIIAFDKELQSADASVTAAHRERMPILAATASTSWNPADGNSDPQPIWSAGVNLSWQLWDGGKSRADVRVADANVVNTAAQRDALLVNITSTLDSSRASIITSRAAVDSSNEAVTAANTQLKLSEARYTQGLGSQIELADAQTAVTTAEGNLVSSEYQLALAWATLRRALGQ